MRYSSTPSESNNFLVEHVTILRDSLRNLTGRDLVQPGTSPNVAAKQVFLAPFVLLSHCNSSDPLFTYGNQTALSLFELSWEALTSLHSSQSAEPVGQAERFKLLHEVTTKGFIDNYSGIRISSSGQRFYIKQATVWNIIEDSGELIGQAACFSEWETL